MVKLWSEYLNHLKSAPQSSLQQYTSVFVISQVNDTFSSFFRLYFSSALLQVEPEKISRFFVLPYLETLFPLDCIDCCMCQLPEITSSEVRQSKNPCKN